VEVRFEGLEVDAQAFAAGRELPSIINAYRNFVEVRSQALCRVLFVFMPLQRIGLLPIDSAGYERSSMSEITCTCMQTDSFLCVVLGRGCCSACT
jgi:hypothetical protein